MHRKWKIYVSFFYGSGASRIVKKIFSAYYDNDSSILKQTFSVHAVLLTRMCVVTKVTWYELLE
jgi:hypothetical protein